jgi:hypothetical protein
MVSGQTSRLEVVSASLCQGGVDVRFGSKADMSDPHFVYCSSVTSPTNRPPRHRAFLEWQYGHGGRWCRTMPVLLTGQKPNNISGSEFFDGPALSLRPTEWEVV